MRLILTGRRLFLILPIVLITFFSGALFSGTSKLNPFEFKAARPTDVAVSATLPALKNSLPRSGGQLAELAWLAGLAKLASTQDPTRARGVASQETYTAGSNDATIEPAAPNQTSPQGASLPSLTDFISRVANENNPNTPSGVYVRGLLTLAIIQQPAGDDAYIDQGENTATQFQLATPYQTIGLLAHNFLAGQYFFDLTEGQQISLVFGDRHVKTYRITEIDDFQRLIPGDLSSDFMGLSDGKDVIAGDVFARFYENPHTLVLQTCIDRAGQSDWGVRFIVARLVD